LSKKIFTYDPIYFGLRAILKNRSNIEGNYKALHIKLCNVNINTITKLLNVNIGYSVKMFICVFISLDI
jgi:hypothetical protein